MRPRFASCPGHPPVASVLFGAAVWLLSACHLVLDDIDPGEDSPTQGHGGSGGKGGASSGGGTTAVVAGGSTGSAFCPGNLPFFCKDRTLVDCVTGASTVCRSATLCQSLGNARCLTCSAGELSCQDNVLMRCNATQDGWDVQETCSGSKPVCDADSNACEVCSRSDKQCQGIALYECDAIETRGWKYRRDCPTQLDPRGCVTDDTRTAHCVDCDPDSYVPACTSASAVAHCVGGELVDESCENGCADADGSVAAFCR